MYDTVRWGILGNAWIARDFMIPAIEHSDLCRIAAVASRSCFPDNYAPEAVHYTSYEELLADPAVEAVYVPVPNALHAEWTIKALEAGKHVLCEKPVSCTAAEAAAMYDAAEKNSVLLMEAFMYRYGTKCREMLRILDSGVLGKIRGMYGSHGYLLNWDSPARMDPALGGGCIYDVGCYVADAMNLVMRRTGAKAQAARSVMRLQGGVDWHAAASVLFDDGTAGTLQCWFDGEADQQFLIAGENGTLRIPDLFEPGDGQLILTVGGSRTVIDTKEGTDPYQLEAEMLSRAIRDEDVPLISREETLDNMRLLEMLLADSPSAGE